MISPLKDSRVQKVLSVARNTLEPLRNLLVKFAGVYRNKGWHHVS